MTELTILMPCLDEAETLATCIGKAKRFLIEADVDGEVLIADNGSTDGSVQIAEDNGAKVVHVADRGYGAAILGGIDAAEGRYIIMGDADDSYDFSALLPFLMELRAGAQLVMGNRFKGGIEPGAMPFLHRYVGNPVLSFVGRLFFGSKLGDFHCGLRGFNRDAIQSLRLVCPGMEFASEMVVKATLASLDIREVLTTLRPDGRTRAPHLNTWRDGWRHLRFLVMFSPRWMFLYPGALMLMLGLAFSAILALTPVGIGAVVFDIQTLLYTSAMTIIGLQMLSLALIVRLIGNRTGYLPDSMALDTAMRWITVERGLIIGLLLTVAGAIWTVNAVLQWSDVDFSELNPRIAMRSTIPAATLVIIGVQTIVHALLLGAIDTLGVTRQRAPGV